MHARDDALVPFDEGRHLVSLIPDARFASVESANHVLLEDEPAWAEFCAQLRAFLPRPLRPRFGDVDGLTGREQQVLALVVTGHGNAAVAAALHLSVRTVERHLSNCYTKLGLTGKSARAAAAVRHATHSGQTS
jgi:DNA-binding NarL/FixJ family response regulator